MEEICSELESKLVEMQGELELMEMDRDDHRERLAQVKELKHKMEGDLTSAMKEIMVSRGDCLIVCLPAYLLPVYSLIMCIYICLAVLHRLCNSLL